MKLINPHIKYYRKRLMSVGFALCLLLVISCDEEVPTVKPEQVAYVSLYNAAPDSPDLDIMVDNNQINTYPFDYTNYTGYLRFNTGNRNLRFKPIIAENIVLDTTLSLKPNGAYSIFVIDKYPRLKTLIVEDPFNIPSTGNAMVRFVNLSPDAPELQLLIGDGFTLTFKSFLEAKSFKQITKFQEIPADDYYIKVRNDEQDITLYLPDVYLQDGLFYTIVVRGFNHSNGDSTKDLKVEVITN